MSASQNIAVAEFAELFRDTWVECEAFRAKQALGAVGQSMDWERGLKAARAEAYERFEPLLASMRCDRPLTPLLRKLISGIRAAERAQVEYKLAALSRKGSE